MPNFSIRTFNSITHTKNILFSFQQKRGHIVIPFRSNTKIIEQSNLLKHIEKMSRYHLWAYEQLYQSVDKLPEEEYKKDVKLFFKSIHGTLNHLHLVDKLWYGRFINKPISIKGLDEELYADRKELKEAIFTQANDWIEYVSTISTEELTTSLTYTNTKGKEITTPFSETLLHVFNHGTLHLGQISTVITQLGYHFPVMGLLFFKPEKTTTKLETRSNNNLPINHN